MRAYAVVAAGVVLGIAAVSGASASAAAPRAARVAASHAAPSPGTQLWVKRYHDAAGGSGADVAYSVAVSPDGGTVFVTGYSPGSAPDSYATVAYNAVTGAQLWVKRYNGIDARGGEAYSLAVSPTGKAVYVTGESPGLSGFSDYATVAYNAATGAQLWVKRYNGPGNGSGANSVAVSPNGGTVFVTGSSAGTGSKLDTYFFATVAYNATTGAQLWLKRYNGISGRSGDAYSVAVSPSGKTVFVTGYSNGIGATFYTTVAYSATTGAQLWVQRYNGISGHGGSAYKVAVSPSGSAVYVTGGVAGGEYATVAYNAVTGAPLWTKLYNSGAGAVSLAVSPSGGTVFVTGGSSTSDYATVAYSASAGAQLWAKRYTGPRGFGTGDPTSVAVSPTGGTVYVTGSTGETATDLLYGTVAYNAATGAQLWAKDYNGPGNVNNVAYSVAISPTRGTVFVTGYSWGNLTGPDYATIAYSG
jgi:outer membrane protein assembly factor BamB